MSMQLGLSLWNTPKQEEKPKESPVLAAVRSVEKPTNIGNADASLNCNPYEYYNEFSEEQKNLKNACPLRDECGCCCSQSCYEWALKTKNEQKAEIVNKRAEIVNTPTDFSNISKAFYTCPRCGVNTGKVLTFNFRFDICTFGRVCFDCKSELEAMEVKQEVEHESPAVEKNNENIRQRVRFIDLIHDIDKKFFKYAGILGDFMNFIKADLVDIESFKKYFDCPDSLRALMIEFNEAKASV